MLHLRWIGAQQNFTLLYHKSAILHREQNIHELLKRCKKGKIPGFNALGSRLLPQIHSYKHKKFVSACYGGGEGNRTPVRRQLGKNFSGRSLLFTFPHPGGNKHPTGISSFMMHGMGKAYHTHGLHSDHTRARLVDLPGRMGA